jgi:hypothetical protein
MMLKLHVRKNATIILKITLYDGRVVPANQALQPRYKPPQSIFICILLMLKTDTNIGTGACGSAID